MKTPILIAGRIPATWSGRYEKCRSCHAEIGWAKTKKNNWISFDPMEHVTKHEMTCPKTKRSNK